MISKADFKSTIGNRFWRHIWNKTQLPFTDIEQIDSQDRIKYLTELHLRLAGGEYVPLPPRGYIVAQKGEMVARFIPVFKPQDYCVYFYAIKKLEDKLAKNRTPGTFGGFTLGGAIRRLEREEEASEYWTDTSFNQFGWLDAWKDFQKKAYNLYRYNSRFKFFGIFDLANFYDSVSLDLLESKVRAEIDKDNLYIVNLLFFFLRNSNRSHLPYSQHSVGLPQDEVGDCSRILANFYLQDYDSYVKKLCDKKGAKYLRYADDQIIAAKSEETVREIVFMASKELTRIGLNLNAWKAKPVTREQYQKYWSFDIHKLLDTGEVDRALDGVNTRLAGMGAYDFRDTGLVRRLISIKPRSINRATKNRIIELSLNQRFLTQLSVFHLSCLYRLSTNDQKRKLLRTLGEMSGKILFNQFHLRVLSFCKQEKINDRIVGIIRQNMERLESF